MSYCRSFVNSSTFFAVLTETGLHGEMEFALRGEVHVSRDEVWQCLQFRLGGLNKNHSEVGLELIPNKLLYGEGTH